MAAKKKPEGIFFVEKIEVMPLSKLKAWKRNPRHNDPAVEPIAKSIKKYGMLVPILINKKNEVLAGNTRLKAGLLLGMERFPCVRAEHLTVEEQQMYNIADNKLGEIATWDHDMLKDILTDLQAKFEQKFDPALIGMQQAELDLMFDGWNSSAQRITDVESDAGVAPGKIVIECLAADEEDLRVNLQNFLTETGLEGVKIR